MAQKPDTDLNAAADGMTETLPMTCEEVTDAVAESLDITPESRVVGVLGPADKQPGSANSWMHNSRYLPGNGNYRAAKAVQRHSHPVELGHELAAHAISTVSQEIDGELRNLDKYSLCAVVCEKFVWKVMVSETYAVDLYAAAREGDWEIVNPQDEAAETGETAANVVERWESNNIDGKIVETATGETELIQVKTDVSRIKPGHKEGVHAVLDVKTAENTITVADVVPGELA